MVAPTFLNHLLVIRADLPTLLLRKAREMLNIFVLQTGAIMLLAFACSTRLVFAVRTGT